MTHDELNLEQRRAVESDSQNILIIAGPGTGKTHTLTCRIAFQLQTLDPDKKILAITFTNKAAEDMNSRLKARLGKIDGKVFVGTFHQWCLSLLRQYGRGGEIRVAAPEDVLKTARGLWPGMTKGDLRKCLEKVSYWKSVDFKSDPPREAAVLSQALRAGSFYDFDDLLLEARRLLLENSSVLADVRKHYVQVYVDEYQDINPIQHELLKLSIGDTGRITAIGDPDQAIYAFRGSDARFFECFEDDFFPVEKIHLRENYRSAHDLISASGQMIASARDVNVPPQVARIYQEGLLSVHRSATDKAEAEFVVHTIEQLVGGTSMFSQDSGRVESHGEGAFSFGDFAVLYRLKNQARELKKAFERSGIPFSVAGEDSSGEDFDDDLLAQRKIEQDVLGERVALMTLHASKGLEFECVFVCGCEETLLPLGLEGIASDPQEERRLLYVGMTRAKSRLYLVSAKRRMLYGKTFENAPSPFLADIEEGLKKYSQQQYLKKTKKRDDDQIQLF
ncbi:MAG TPA: ATP-dependent helicase [Candidatus Omnitrophota bacterium]|nr:ATP-dependent helicase [Candidatus Omnitrophota bacterium]HSA31708.1 ATP-dependent helicase [Candidatus Omnitrophota bacterium]